MKQQLDESEKLSEIKSLLFKTAKKTVSEKGFDMVIQFEEQAKALLKYFESCQEQSKESDAMEFAEWIRKTALADPDNGYDKWQLFSKRNLTTKELYNLFKTTPLKG